MVFKSEQKKLIRLFVRFDTKLSLIFTLTFPGFTLYTFYLTVIYPVFVLLPAEFLTVKVTVYFPALLYLCAGFLSVEYVLSPKLHLHEVGEPVLCKLNLQGSFHGGRRC
jgi:hypothetical protein